MQNFFFHHFSSNHASLARQWAPLKMRRAYLSFFCLCHFFRKRAMKHSSGSRKGYRLKKKRKKYQTGTLSCTPLLKEKRPHHISKNSKSHFWARQGRVTTLVTALFSNERNLPNRLLLILCLFLRSPSIFFKGPLFPVFFFLFCCQDKTLNKENLTNALKLNSGLTEMHCIIKTSLSQSRWRRNKSRCFRACFPSSLLVYVFRFQTQERGLVQQSSESVKCVKTNGPKLAAQEDEDAINIDLKQ